MMARATSARSQLTLATACALVIWLSACAGMADPAPAAAPAAPAQPTESAPSPAPESSAAAVESAPGALDAWQAYTNTEAGFSIQFPADWSLDLPADQSGGLYQTAALKGPQGGVDLHWGTGFGGGCPQGTITVTVMDGDLPACHSKRENGAAFWAGIGKQLETASFTAEAYTSDAEAASQELVLRVLSTLSFAAPGQ